MNSDSLYSRHIGPSEADARLMLQKMGYSSLDELIEKTIPSNIRLKHELQLPEPLTEAAYLDEIREIGAKNKLFKTYIGQGYYNTFTPSVIKRNILENPSWYTSYTPYQAEISQGRLQALLTYQTVITDLTAMSLANASLLDEATAAAEVMHMFFAQRSVEGANRFFIDKQVFIQTIEVVRTRAEFLGVEVITGDYSTFEFDASFFGALVQYPAANGQVCDYASFVAKAHATSCFVAVAADLLSLTLLTPPGEWGADCVVGSSQRFGIPMGYGGPHAAFFATREVFKRNMPGRIIGVTRDVSGKPALRMALQTREQHIKRERATSNICTAQALLAIMAGMYAVYHGAEGLVNIARRIHASAFTLANRLQQIGFENVNTDYFDTLQIRLPADIKASEVVLIALEHDINLHIINASTIGISLDETTGIEDLNLLVKVFAIARMVKFSRIIQLLDGRGYSGRFVRTSAFLTLDVFTRYRSETEMMRYLKKLEKRDISLTHSMISLGSCTMKLNAASELMALSQPEFGNLHPFAPIQQAEGYHQLFNELKNHLIRITGFSEVSFQPNSGAAGEYAGLLVIRRYHESREEGYRNIALIPSSAHGTNPASATMAGLKVVVVACDEKGNISIADLQAKAEQYKDQLAVVMITYPSTHGVFESAITDMTRIVHQYGGQVYMDGANMNAQVGLTSPGAIGADVCHLNLHKTFAIPHGGGGPGVGPICVAEHLVEFLPAHPVMATGGNNGVSAISAAPWGSASILTISHAYCRMMGSRGLTDATRYAILNANYLASQLKELFPILYTGENGTVAHEMILDCRPVKALCGITELDIAKRLMDYGFHAPTLSFPVAGTLMVEPTESESLAELDRFIDALKAIYNEIQAVSTGRAHATDNVLKNAPHTAEEIAGDEWNHPYSRKQAVFPLPWVAENKYWPSVKRVDDAFGDRNLVCSCAPIESYLIESGRL